MVSELTRVPKTDAELRAMAILIEGGGIFTDRHIAAVERARMIPSVFMVLPLMEPEQRQEMIDHDVSLLYEEIARAAPRWSANGYPAFWSLQYLSREEVERLDRFLA